MKDPMGLETVGVLGIEDENQTERHRMTEAAQSNATKSTFKPIYPATVVPGAIENKVTVKGKPYIVAKDSKITSTKSGKTSTRTLMVFGKSVDMVGDRLVAGQAVELAVQNDNGAVKVIGEVLPPKEAAQG